MKIVKRVGAVLLALLTSISVPFLILVAVIIAFRQIFTEWSSIRAGLLVGNLICSVNADCPPGYECMGGRCLPKPAR